jgi:hypothetical protein
MLRCRILRPRAFFALAPLLAAYTATEGCRLPARITPMIRKDKPSRALDGRTSPNPVRRDESRLPEKLKKR